MGFNQQNGDFNGMHPLAIEIVDLPIENGDFP